MPSFGEPLDAQPRHLGVRPTFFPGVDTARAQGEPLVSVEAPVNHLESAQLDSDEYPVSITG